MVQEQHTTSTEGDVEDIESGQFEVQLEGMGVPAEDIATYRRIEARLAKVEARRREATKAAQPSTSHMQTRSKGREPKGAQAEAARYVLAVAGRGDPVLVNAGTNTGEEKHTRDVLP